MSIESDKFGMIKTMLDAHTMGIHAAAGLLRDCGFNVIISPTEIQDALDRIMVESAQNRIISWIRESGVNRLGVSYRLDPLTAVEILGRLVFCLRKAGLYETEGAQIKSIYFAGLKPACDLINAEYGGKIGTFCGGESAEDTLLKMGVPEGKIPKKIKDGCRYDKELFDFGKEIVFEGEYATTKPFEKNNYPELGTMKDSLMLRLRNNFVGGFQPLIRAHSGPFSADSTREYCLKEYIEWCKELAKAGFLDILSIGTSQLSQSNFGEKWGDKLNGGGVPVNSEQEFADIWKASCPMLVRTYSATKNILPMAKMYEKTINNAWNALSLWWFNELDGRGGNNLYINLCEHINTIGYFGKIGKPIETNVPHHFAFRGCDDVSYIVSAYLAAKIAKKCGVKYFILQNMLNTPRSTWGIQDIAKSRVLLKVVKELENKDFRVILQTRAGLDYFKPDIEQAKIQLAAVTAMMDDIDPHNMLSPDIIHVVSYSEALFLATPSVIDDSIKITRTALRKYREKKRMGDTPSVFTEEIFARVDRLNNDVRQVIHAMEKTIPNLYSPSGMYLAFVTGWLPVPELWSDKEEYNQAKCWQTKMVDGGVALVENDVIMTMDRKINKCVSNLPNALYVFKEKYGVEVL